MIHIARDEALREENAWLRQCCLQGDGVVLQLHVPFILHVLGGKLSNQNGKSTISSYRDWPKQLCEQPHC